MHSTAVYASFLLVCVCVWQIGHSGIQMDHSPGQVAIKGVGTICISLCAAGILHLIFKIEMRNGSSVKLSPEEPSRDKQPCLHRFVCSQRQRSVNFALVLGGGNEKGALVEPATAAATEHERSPYQSQHQKKAAFKQKKPEPQTGLRI